MTLIDRSFREKIFLVGVVLGSSTIAQVEDDLDELALLVDTAGADVVGRMLQKRDTPDPATFIGSGKALELAALCNQFDADTVVFDEELSPAQQRNLEKILGRTAIDRPAVILDIFAQNARTEAGVIQVELALLSYRLPRLRGRGVFMSQQGGGIGTRGPGETKLEVDRRALLERMHKLQRQIKDITKVRSTQRRNRLRSSIPKVSLVGYTNAGKSTLLNALTGSDVLVENRLFATLDPRMRALRLRGRDPVVIADTVGFIRKLPHELIEAFRSTLEEVCDSDLLIHVVNSSSADALDQINAVRSVLDEIGASHIPEVKVFNKADVAKIECKHLESLFPGSVVVSALKNTGMRELKEVIFDRIEGSKANYMLEIPISFGALRSKIHEHGSVIDEETVTKDSGEIVYLIKVRMDPKYYGEIADFICDEGKEIVKI